MSEPTGPDRPTEAPLNAFETKRVLAAADILASAEYDAPQVAGLIRRLVRAAAQAGTPDALRPAAEALLQRWVAWQAAGADPTDIGQLAEYFNQVWAALKEPQERPIYRRDGYTDSNCTKADAISLTAAALVAKLDEVAPHLTSQAVYMQAHGMSYTGPNYGDELKALRAALAVQRTVAGTTPAPNLQTAIDWIAGAAKHEPSPEAQRFAAAMVLSLTDVLRASTREATAGSYSAAAPAVGRSDQHGPTASAAPPDEETQLAILGIGACASAAADWQRVPLHAKDVRLLLAEITRLRAALAGGAPAAPAPEIDNERADDWTDNEGASGAAPGRAPAPERLRLADFIENEGSGDVPLHDEDIKLIVGLLRGGIDTSM